MFSSLKNALLCFLMVAVVIPAVANCEDFKVVASSDFNFSQISKTELRDLYLGNLKRIESGFVVQTARGSLTSKSMEAFLTEILGMSSRDFVTQWRIKLFSSRGLPPKALDTDEQVVFFLHATPQALGIVSTKADIGNLRVLTVVE